MTRTAWQQSAFLYAGLTAGPLLWSINVQLGQILPYRDCFAPIPLLAPISWGFAALSLGGGYVSWRSIARVHSEHVEPGSPHMTRFVGTLSALAGALFAFALMLQGLATVMLSGCER